MPPICPLPVGAARQRALLELAIRLNLQASWISAYPLDADPWHNRVGGFSIRSYFQSSLSGVWMRSLLLLSLALTLTSGLLPGVSQSQVFERFYVDSSRSFIAFDSGELSGQLGTSLFPFASLTSQPGVMPVPLSGNFVLQITPDLVAPGAIVVVQGSTDLRAADANQVSPAPGGVPGMVDAAFGLTFDDPLAGVSGDIAIVGNQITQRCRHE